MARTICSSCKSPVWWAITTAGKRMPMDPAPTDAGNMIIIDRDQPAPIVKALRPREAVAPDVPRYVSHFATCPNSRAHRRSR
jgi:hypothetical protein